MTNEHNRNTPICEIEASMVLSRERIKQHLQPTQSSAWTLILLLTLYILQGIPMGISAFLRMELKHIFKGSFSEVGTFALASWPFSLKVFWAPIVDACYVERFGRRKSWLVPAQVLISFFLLYLAGHVEQLLEDRRITTLTVLFFCLYALCATQDIAVDGWSITMLDEGQQGYSSVCNAAGQGLGFLIGMTGPSLGIVSLPTFLTILSGLFLVVSLLVAVLQSEQSTPADEQVPSIWHCYKCTARVCQLPAVQRLSLYLLTCRIAVVPIEEMAIGKLQDLGLDKQSAAWTQSAGIVLVFVVPWVLTAVPQLREKFLNTPLLLVEASYIPKLLLTPYSLLLVMPTGLLDEAPSWSWYASLVVLVLLNGVMMEVMFSSHFAFFANVSDPQIGGSYMTLLSSLHNFGGAWAIFAGFKLSDYLDVSSGGQGYQTLAWACTLFGFCWLWFASSELKSLQSRPISDWRVKLD